MASTLITGPSFPSLYNLSVTLSVKLRGNNNSLAVEQGYQVLVRIRVMKYTEILKAVNGGGDLISWSPGPQAMHLLLG